MGCDIHAFIEYKSNQVDINFNSFTDGEINIPRDYKIFSAIALGEGGIDDDVLFKTRGLPLNCSSAARELFFDDAEAVKKDSSLGNENYLWNDEEELQDLVDVFGEVISEEYIKRNRLPNVDFYGASWLNFNELLGALKHWNIQIENLSAEFRAVLATMQILSEKFEIENVRLVFWFDGAG